MKLYFTSPQAWTWATFCWLHVQYSQRTDWHVCPLCAFLLKLSRCVTHAARPYKRRAICSVSGIRQGRELQQENGATSSAASSLSIMEVSQIEHRASARTVSWNIAVRLTRDANSRTFYYITVVNTLTAMAEVSIGQAINSSQSLISFSEWRMENKTKHGADVARVGGQYFPLVVSTTGVLHPDSLKRLQEVARYALMR